MKSKRACIDCGGTHIRTQDCGYSSFNVGFCECIQCGKKLKLNNCDAYPDEQLISFWNEANPTIKKAIKDREKSIEMLKNSIKEDRKKIRELKKRMKQ